MSAQVTQLEAAVAANSGQRTGRRGPIIRRGSAAVALVPISRPSWVVSDAEPQDTSQRFTALLAPPAGGRQQAVRGVRVTWLMAGIGGADKQQMGNAVPARQGPRVCETHGAMDLAQPLVRAGWSAHDPCRAAGQCDAPPGCSR
jgi:hypothetical protein